MRPSRATSTSRPEETANNNIWRRHPDRGQQSVPVFTGNHENFTGRSGPASPALTDQIMYGGDVKDRIQNSALLTLPGWYLNGLISYVAPFLGCGIDKPGTRRDHLRPLPGSSTTSPAPTRYTPVIPSGKYIIDTTKESSVSNLLYMTRINRNVEAVSTTSGLEHADPDRQLATGHDESLRQFGWDGIPSVARWY